KISKYPSVSRDISFLVDKSVLAGDIIKAIKTLNINILKYVSIFDIYESQDSDRKSFALNMLFQVILQTLDDKVIVESID
ncbi:phenylalanine--tRNA ligase subunit beta, partial [Francisella tularensis subsp. holarctica]|nr:phenylalanine--tRNA ligase subunit beta [Francisella tularensis subsp. holarctica]